MYKFIPIILALFMLCDTANAQQTQQVYLSGTGAKNTTQWDFKCSEGRNCGDWSTIEVPSQWEQQGFGEYNYGHVPFDQRLKETGTYRYQFNVPESWSSKKIKIVFEGVMTDARVQINGKSAGEMHQGAFYPFDYEITKLLNYGGTNTLQVAVDKFSSNMSINRAERQADYWVFGGIFRPVYLEVLPQEYIDRVAIDAKADGSIKTEAHLADISNAATVTLNVKSSDGTMQTSFSGAVDTAQRVAHIDGQMRNPDLWSPEFPNLYHFQFQLKDQNGDVIHTVEERTGFRTVEVRAKDGIYVNGKKVKLKGVNRHTFHPNYGRASDKVFSIADINRIKNMNMNAVRMSHYPPDQHFLEVADSLGLFVLDELAGWQHPGYDEKIGRKLLKEMIYDDMNHPSIILWNNGNEGGWNTVYDDQFQELDIQNREVMHPWGVHNKINAAHYFNYNYLSMDNFAQGKIFLPTEFLHGLYDGGHGAGLEDYWQKMYNDPLTAGGFLWAFADECVNRTDTGKLDCDGNHAPDGIFSPYFKKEGSFFSIREIWSPLFIDERHITPDFDGVFNIENRFLYTNMDQVRINYEWVQLPPEEEQEIVLHEGEASVSDTPPGRNGTLSVKLGDRWKESDLLRIEAYDPQGRHIHTWSWPVKSPAQYAFARIPQTNNGAPAMKELDGRYQFSSGDFFIEINKDDGMLHKAGNARGEFPIHGGPFLRDEGLKCESVEAKSEDNGYKVTASCKEERLNMQWTIRANGWVDLDVQYQLPRYQRDYAGISFLYPEEEMESVKYVGDGPYRVWKNRMAGPQFGAWDKAFNNTVTGYSAYEYPEFKGFYSNMYETEFRNKTSPDFSVYSKTENIFLRLLTPENPPDPVNTKVEFPAGDISFMHGILPIGTKFKTTDLLGAQSQKYDYLPRRLQHGHLSMSLTFDFSGK